MVDSEIERLKALKARAMLSDMGEKTKGEPQVEVYSTPTCPYCVMAKQYFDSKGIKYKDFNVAEDMQAAQKMISSTGQQGVPQININGKWIIGFNKPSIDDMLNL